jgi:hypothetical protein
MRGDQLVKIGEKNVLKIAYGESGGRKVKIPEVIFLCLLVFIVQLFLTSGKIN